MEKIREIIVVEGRDDTAAVKRALEAETIETHGFGISKGTWELIDEAYRRSGIIIFTDPDHSGEVIRKKLSEKYPDAKHAYLSEAAARQGSDIGVENAGEDDIREAVGKAHCTLGKRQDIFTFEDMEYHGLTGLPGSAKLREELGQALGIGHGNSKSFLRKLNAYGIGKAEFLSCLQEIDR